MNLSIGLCYAVELTNGSVVKFRFLGQDKNGKVVVETPPGSGKQEDLMTLIQGGYLAYWEINCP